MRNLLFSILLFAQTHCLATTFIADTIDNWQIYHGGKLILAGNSLGVLAGPEIAVVLKKAALNDLRIKYNHCAVEYLPVTIELLSSNNKVLFTRNFDPASNNDICIPKEALNKLSAKHRYLRIRYKENKTNGVDLILGAISLQ